MFRPNRWQSHHPHPMMLCNVGSEITAAVGSSRASCIHQPLAALFVIGLDAAIFPDYAAAPDICNFVGALVAPGRSAISKSHCGWLQGQILELGRLSAPAFGRCFPGLENAAPANAVLLRTHARPPPFVSRARVGHTRRQCSPQVGLHLSRATGALFLPPQLTRASTRGQKPPPSAMVSNR